VKFAETLKLAIAAIWAHKLRSALTLLGMIIGVTAFVVVVSLISGFNKYIDEKIAGIGSKSFTIQRFNFEDFKDLDSIAAAQRRNKELTLDDYEYLKARGALIDKIGAKARASRSLVKRGSTIVEDVPVDGSMPIINEIDNIDTAEGRYFTDSENDGAMRVAYIGMDVANALFPAGEATAIGEEINVAGLPYRIIGVRVAKAAQVYVGSTGLYASAVLAGLTDVDAITLSLVELHRGGVAGSVAVTGITLAAITNTLVKGGIAAIAGGQELGRRVGVAFALVLGSGGAALLLVQFLGS